MHGRKNSIAKGEPVRVAVLILFLTSASVAFAQLPTATILGVVKDASGAVVPGATVTARNVNTGQSRNTVTAADGSYRLAALPVGSYEVRVEHPGFQSEVRSGLTLAVSQEAVVNFALQVGAVEQTIAVTAEAPLVNTTSGTLGGLVDEQRMADLPLNGRNFVDLSLLQTGVTEHQNINRGTARVGTWFSSNGAPLRSNNFLLDGAPIQTLHGTGSAGFSNSTLGVEGIREYRVVTNTFSAEYGMRMGSQTLIVTKSGTNQFHGTLFEFLRNSALDARNFFDLQTAASSRRLPAFVRNNFGGSIGGPIKHDKTFFHVTFEAVKERLGVTTISQTIPASARVDGGLVPVIAPVIKPILAVYPLPNLPNDKFTFPFTQPTNEYYGQARADHTFSTNDSVFVRYTADAGNQAQTAPLPPFQTIGFNRYQWVTLSENHIFSPTLLNTARMSFSRTRLGFNDNNSLVGPGTSLVTGKPLGGISPGSGITNLGNQGTLLYAQNIYTWSDDLFYTRGRHSLKFGFLINALRMISNTSLATPYGSVNFADLSRFLLAQPISYNAFAPGADAKRTYRYNTYGFYLQDDLRVGSRLTFNLGLRYEFNTTPIEQNGKNSALRDVIHDATFTLGPVIQNSSLRNWSPRFGFAWDVKGDGKTAVRGGFGLLYDVGWFNSTLVMDGTGHPPFSNQSRVVNPPTLVIPLQFPPESVGRVLRPIDYHTQQPHMLEYNLTVERQLPFAMGLTLAYAGSRGINLPFITEGNPTLPRILPDGRQFWTGLEPRLNPNFADLTFMTNATSSWYNSLQFGLLKRLSKGLQFQSSYTYSKLLDENQAGLNGDISNTTGVFNPDPFHRQVNRGVAQWDTPHNWKFNMIYRLPEARSWGALPAKLLNGWWISSIVSLQSGYPLTVGLNQNRSRSLINGAGTNIDRPDLVAGVNPNNITHGTSRGCGNIPAGTPVGTTTRWYDPCAFTIPAAGFLGTAGRNIVRAPGVTNWNFSLVKDTALRPLGEAGQIQFRAEFFNILNNVNFAPPNRTAYTGARDVENPLATAGNITSTNGTARQIQLALKILF